MPLIKNEISDFLSVYSDYLPLLYSTVYAKIGDADDTEDICQEVFTRYFEKQSLINNPRRWLYGCMKNVIFEYYRDKKHKTIDIEEYFQDISMAYVNGFRDTRIIIEEAFNAIKNFDNEQDRILFELIAVKKFSITRTAKELGFPTHRARYRYKIISERILNYLKNKGVGSLEELL